MVMPVLLSDDEDNDDDDDDDNGGVLSHLVKDPTTANKKRERTITAIV